MKNPVKTLVRKIADKIDPYGPYDPSPKTPKK